MTLKETFEQAVANSKLLSSKPDNDTLLRLYSLYKQSTTGDNLEDAPTNPFDFVGRAKHDAWSKLTGLSPDEAMKQYIDLVEGLRK